jgi:aminoglycoside 6'-N-acetyltransferase
VSKPINAYIINFANQPIGYIQSYNAYDFARSAPLVDLPSSLAALDILIGDTNAVGKGIGSLVLTKFLAQYIDPHYEYCFVDPDMHNLAAIKCYEQAGFAKLKLNQETEEMFMLRGRS